MDPIRLFLKNHPHLHPKVIVLRQTIMYDSVDLGQIPKKAQAVAGYVGGKWPTYPRLWIAFPKAHRLSIAVSASEDADCLDIENGDATTMQAASWVLRQRKRGLKVPWLYTSVSNVSALVWELKQKGIRRDQVKIWAGHYTGKPHLCSSWKCGFSVPGGADATQYDDHALGRNLDVSLCSRNFWRKP